VRCPNDWATVHEEPDDDFDEPLRSLVAALYDVARRLGCDYNGHAKHNMEINCDRKGHKVEE
jgi:hypothetical protein